MINRARKEWITHCLTEGKNWSYEPTDYNLNIIYVNGVEKWAIRFVRCQDSYTLVEQINLDDVFEGWDTDTLKAMLDKHENVHTADWAWELRLWAKTHPNNPKINDVLDVLKIM